MAEARLTAVVSTKGAKKSTEDLKKFSRTAGNADKKVTKITKNLKKGEGSFKSFGKNASASIAAINGPLGGISSRVSSVLTVLTSGTAVVTGLALAVTALGASVAIGVLELDKLNIAAAKTDAILKATGGAVGLTTEQLNANARAIALNTLASVEGIQQAQAVLLTFNRVQGKTSERALELSQDLATVFGGTAASQATALGKALQDPTLGITALSRVGVTFTQVQKDQIKLFQQTGDAAKAQQIILDELTGQVGGAGGAVAAGTLAGAFDTAGQLFDEFTVSLANATGAYDITLNFINKLSTGLKTITGILETNPLDGLAGDAERTKKLAELTEEILSLKEAQLTVGNREAKLVRARLNNALLEKQAITEAIAEEQKLFDARDEAVRKSEAIAAKQKSDDLAAVRARIDAEEKAKFDASKRIADKEIASILAINDTELEAIRSKEEEKAALLQSYREKGLVSESEYFAALREIEVNSLTQRSELRDKDLEAQKAKFDEQNALVISSGELVSESIAQNFLDVAKGQATAKDAILGTIGAVSDMIFKSLAQQLIQQQIVDRVISAGFLKQKASEAATSTAQAAQNAFTSTAGAPFPFNLGAPAAAASAGAAAGALGSSVVAAASAREQGGSLAAGQSSTVAERGQLEILTPASNSRVRTAQQMKGIMGDSGGGSPQVSLVVIDQSTGSKEFEQSTDDDGRIILLIRSTVSGDMGDANSQISKSFGANTNAQRAGR